MEASIPPQLRPPSPVTPTPPTTQANRIYCANTNCVTKQGPRTQGSKTCIEHKCKACCIRAVSRAETEGVGRARCNAHVQAAVAPSITLPQALPSSNIPPPRPSTTNNSGELIRLPQRMIEPIMLSASTTTSCPGQALLTPPSTQPVTPLQRPVRLPAVPSLPQPLPSTQQVPPSTHPLVVSRPPRPTAPRRSLAQPLDDEWAMIHTAAKQEKHQMKTLKFQQQEMEERKRRTCQLIIYHTVSPLT